MDEDLDALSREQLVAEVKRLRNGIRQHRDSTGDDLCWHHPDLWTLLPEKLTPELEVPDWPQFMRGCVRYRQSLDAQAPPRPARVAGEFDVGRAKDSAGRLPHSASTRKTTETYPEKVWVGPKFTRTGVFVLGESWFGDYPDHLATDDGYIRAYLKGEVTDALYTRIANATGLGKQPFWESIMFTNFVSQPTGPTRAYRPTAVQYKQALPRLASLLKLHRPRGVWIIGKEQAAYSEPVVREAVIPVAVSPHPTSYGIKHEVLRAAWDELLRMVGVLNRRDDA